VPAMIRCRARCRRAKSRTASSRGSTGPDVPGRGRKPDIAEELKKGKQIRRYDLQVLSGRL